MAFKDWDNIPFGATDCIRDNTEWNNMVTYIKHSASCDFTIYDDEDSTNQKFRFTYSGTSCIMYGSGDTGDDLLVYANDVDALYMALRNTGEFELFDGATQMLEVKLNGAITEIIGGSLSTHDISIQPNSAVGSPKLLMYGNSDSYYDIPTGSHFYWRSGFTSFLALYESGTYDIIHGQTAGNDLKIVSQEGIHNAFKAGEEFKLFDGANEAFKITYAANVTTVEGGAVTADDLVLKANSIDAFSKIELFGDGNIYYTCDSNNDHKWIEGTNDIMQYDGGNGNFAINGDTHSISAHYDLLLKGEGVLCMVETTTPTADTNYGKIYCKADNKLYFQDGAGAEHEVAFI